MDNTLKGFVDQREQILSIEDEEIQNDRYDKNRDKIFCYIRDNIKKLAIEEILEAIDHCGYAPSLLNNDDGMWAIATDGIQSVGEGAYDFESTFWVDKENWSSTIRGALRIYIDDYFSSDIYSKCIK